MVSRTSWSLFAAAALSMAAGCGPTVNDGHCIYNRGDAGCDSQQQCMAVVGGGLIEDAANGCVDQADAAMLSADGHVHVQHGLPRSLLALPPDLLGSDTVQGVLARVVEADGLERVCAVDEGIPADFHSSDAVTQVIGIRERLDRQQEQRKADVGLATLSRADADGVEAFNAEVLAWTEACAQMLEPGDGSTSDGTTGGSTGSTGDEDGDSSGTGTSTTAGSSSGGDCFDNGDCPSTAPICTPTTGMCVGCSWHDQCGEAACNMETGACLPADAVAQVGMGHEFPTIIAALELLPDFPDGMTIRVHDGGPYLTPIDVAEGSTIALLAADGHQPTWEAHGTPQLVVRGTAFVEGMRFVQNARSNAITVNGGSLWLDRVWITRNGAGIWVPQGNTIVRNSFIATEGLPGYAIAAGDGATLSVVASTLTGTTTEPGLALECADPANVLVRNSIVSAFEDTTTGCPSADFRYSAVTGNADGPGNINTGMLDAEWFVDHPDDLHIPDRLEAIFANIARWELGDPPVDIDGDPRPTVDGTMDYVGADVPPRRD